MTIKIDAPTIDTDTAAVLFDTLLFLEPFTETERSQLFSFGTLTRVAADELLMEEGSNDNSLIILLAGACQIRKASSDRGLGQFKEVVLQYHSGPAVMGEVSFIDQSPCLDTIITTETSYVWTLKAESAQKLFKTHTRLGLKLMRALSQMMAERLRRYTSALASKFDHLELEDVTYLNRNENPVFSKSVRQAMVERILSNQLNRYPDAYSENVIEKLAPWLNLPKEWAMVVPGSSIAIDMLVRAYVTPSTRATVLMPTFEVFRFSINNQHANAEEFAYSNPYKADVEEFLQNTDPDADIIYIANPNTPTSVYHTNEQLAKLLAHRPKSLFVIDEAYIEFTGDFQGVLPLLREHPHRIIVVRTMSKAFGLAGLRLGYLVGHPDRLAPIRSLLIPYSVNYLSQIAACAILDHPEEVAAQTRMICEQREIMVTQLRELGYRVEAGPTNFILLFVNNALDAIKYLRHHDILVRYVTSPAKPHFLGECVRISVGDAAATQKVIEIAKSMRAKEL